MNRSFVVILLMPSILVSVYSAHSNRNHRTNHTQSSNPTQHHTLTQPINRHPDPKTMFEKLKNDDVECAEIQRQIEENRLDVNAAGSNGYTFLHYAASNGNEAVAEKLLKLGANVNAKNDKNATALHLAAIFGNEAVVELLLNHGAHVDALTYKHQTPLHLAAREDNDGVAELLINKGANINAKDKNNQTPLHVAAQNGKDMVIELLIERGAKVDAEDTKKNTPLQSVCEACEVSKYYNIYYEKIEEIARKLIAHGASIYHRNVEGKTAFDIAKESKCDERIIELLRPKMDPPQQDVQTEEKQKSIGTTPRNVQAIETERPIGTRSPSISRQRNVG